VIVSKGILKMLFEEDEDNEETEENEIEEDNDEEDIDEKPCWICGRKGYKHDWRKHCAWFWSSPEGGRKQITEEELSEILERMANVEE
jgi:hypothetical protein